MTVAQPHISAPRMTGAHGGIGTPARAAVLIAVVIVALVITAWSLAPSLFTQASTADPLLAPHMVDFRAGERAVTAGAVTSDPLISPALAEFRRSEHAEMK